MTQPCSYRSVMPSAATTPITLKSSAHLQHLNSFSISKSDTLLLNVWIETKRLRFSSNQGLPRAKGFDATSAISTSVTSLLLSPRGPSFAHESRCTWAQIRASDCHSDVLHRLPSVWLQLFMVHTAAESLRRSYLVTGYLSGLLQTQGNSCFGSEMARAVHALLVRVMFKKEDREQAWFLARALENSQLTGPQ